MCLSGDHYLDLVSRSGEMVEHDRAPGGMPHAFTDHAVKDAHSRF
jgi:hypothetical protein